MCGICGVVGPLADRHLASRMCEVQRHRGPDDSGIYSDPNICLGNTRLSIIGVKSGKQPIKNEDGTIWITYNGEIYNFRDLRASLQQLGHSFYTDTDTEVIVHCYEEYGTDSVAYLRGMFAFALWDSNSKSILLARDRLGIKPLYYANLGQSFVFASEIKAILSLPGMKREFDPSTLYDYLTFRYVPEPATPFKGIKKLPPGHELVFDARSCKIILKEYWAASDYFNKTSITTIDQAVPYLQHLLGKTVKDHLMSEVPLGVYLSGGLDSSTIVALMRQNGISDIRTFSVSFGGRFDESEHARRVSSYFATDHQEVNVSENDSLLLPQVAWSLEELVADPASIPMFILSKRAKEDVTVILVGEGGDEVFGGYQWYNILHQATRARILPNKLLRSSKSMLRFLPKFLLDRSFQYASALGREGLVRFGHFIESLDNEAAAFFQIISMMTPEEVAEGTLSNYHSSSGLSKVQECFSRVVRDEIAKAQYFDMNNWLPHLLLRTDKTTMASSIEARVPFLDHKVVEYVASLPSELKVRRTVGKYVLRKLARNMLPRAVLARKKQQFFVPLHEWFSGELGEICKQLLLSDDFRKRKLFRQSRIESMFRKLDDSPLYYSRQLWLLLFLEVWLRVFIDSDNLDRQVDFDRLL